MATVHVRKARAGADSWGHTWPTDGAVIELDYDQALILLAIPDGGFSVADDTDATNPDESPDALSEVTPDPDTALTEPAPRRGPGRPRKTT